jgi:hypothetical protein
VKELVYINYHGKLVGFYTLDNMYINAHDIFQAIHAIKTTLSFDDVKKAAAYSVAASYDAETGLFQTRKYLNAFVESVCSELKIDEDGAAEVLAKFK